MHVLFICRGNRGRSQIAEGIFRKLYPEHTVSSAGVVAKHAGELVPSDVVEVMKEIGIDISGAKVKKYENMKADKVIELCKPCTIENAEHWPIEDPEGDEIEALRKTRDLLQKKIEDYNGFT